MRVLLLRPQDEAARAANALAARGHEALSAPLLQVTPVEGRVPPGPFGAVLATSARALRHLPEETRATLRPLPVWAVGARTTAAFQAAGFAQVHAPGAHANDLFRQILRQTPPPHRLLYLAGRDRTPGLERSLLEAGYDLAIHVVYAAHAVEAPPTPLAHALRAGKVDAVLHYSRRSAAIFCALIARAGLMEQARRLRHVAISADAAAGLAPLAPPQLRIAATPDEAGLLDALD